MQPSRLDELLDSLAMKMRHRRGSWKWAVGLDPWDPVGHDIKPRCLGGGDGGVNGADWFCRAESNNEAWAARIKLLGLGRRKMKPKTHC